MKPAALSQWRRLTSVCLRQRLDLLVPVEQISSRALRTLARLLRKVLPQPAASDGERLREALLSLGPVYIKFGQLMSTRKDLFSDEICSALATLQDQVPPIADFDIRGFVNRALDAQWPSAFATLDANPLASASIAQVHRATLTTGEAVVIKVVRPDIQGQIETDMRWLAWCAGKIHHLLADARRFHLPQLVADHHRVLLTELDMFHEARNQIQLRRNFAESELLYVPRVYPQLTRENMLVMEYVDGIPVNQVQRLEAAGVDLQQLANKGVQTFFTQVFEDNFFHADMHPGNILVDASDPANARYIALDCAIIGSLSDTDQKFLAQALVAFFNRDFHTIARLFVQSGWIPADVDIDEFAVVIETLCLPIFEKPLAEISFADFVVELFRAAAQFEMEMQPQLALLQKTLLYIEGVGRQLYPQLDLWQTAKPFIEGWVARELNPLRQVNHWLHRGSSTGNWQIPAAFSEPPQQLHQLSAAVARQQRSLGRMEAALQRQARRQRLSQAAGVVLLLGSGLLLWHSDASLNVTALVGALWGSTLILRA